MFSFYISQSLFHFFSSSLFYHYLLDIFILCLFYNLVPFSFFQVVFLNIFNDSKHILIIHFILKLFQFQLFGIIFDFLSQLFNVMYGCYLFLPCLKFYLLKLFQYLLFLIHLLLEILYFFFNCQFSYVSYLWSIYSIKVCIIGC